MPRILYLAMDERLPLELLGDIADLLLLLLVQPDAPPQNWSLIASVLASTLSPQWLRQPQRPRVSVLDPINVRSGFWHIDTQRWSSRPAVVIRNVLIEVVTAVGVRSLAVPHFFAVACIITCPCRSPFGWRGSPTWPQNSPPRSCAHSSSSGCSRL